jgi:hypothetical protein
MIFGCLFESCFRASTSTKRDRSSIIIKWSLVTHNDMIGYLLTSLGPTISHIKLTNFTTNKMVSCHTQHKLCTRYQSYNINTTLFI